MLRPGEWRREQAGDCLFAAPTRGLASTLHPPRLNPPPPFVCEQACVQVVCFECVTVTYVRLCPLSSSLPLLLPSSMAQETVLEARIREREEREKARIIEQMLADEASFSGAEEEEGGEAAREAGDDAAS